MEEVAEVLIDSVVVNVVESVRLIEVTGVYVGVVVGSVDEVRVLGPL